MIYIYREMFHVTPTVHHAVFKRNTAFKPSA